MLLALIYIDRIRSSENFILTRLNVHRIFITAVLLATKFYDDEVFKNAFYASLGGVTVQELNFLEIDLLNMLKFSLVVPVETYDQYIGLLLDQQRINESRTLPPSPTSITTDEEGTKSLKPVQSNSSFLNTVFSDNTAIWSSSNTDEKRGSSCGSCTEWCGSRVYWVWFLFCGCSKISSLRTPAGFIPHPVKLFTALRGELLHSVTVQQLLYN